MRKMHLAIILLVGLLPCACKSGSPIKPLPEQKQVQTTDAEWETELDGETLGGENRPQVRQAAVDYVRAAMPDWKVLGISLFPYSGTLYIVGIDLQFGEKRQTVNILVRFFLRPDGKTSYWKADPLSPQLAQALLSGYERRKYEDVEKELEERDRSGPD
jgi:hypothetical protein